MGVERGTCAQGRGGGGSWGGELPQQLAAKRVKQLGGQSLPGACQPLQEPG